MYERKISKQVASVINMYIRKHPETSKRSFAKGVIKASYDITDSAYEESGVYKDAADAFYKNMSNWARRDSDVQNKQLEMLISYFQKQGAVEELRLLEDLLAEENKRKEDGKQTKENKKIQREKEEEVNEYIELWKDRFGEPIQHTDGREEVLQALYEVEAEFNSNTPKQHLPIFTEEDVKKLEELYPSQRAFDDMISDKSDDRLHPDTKMYLSIAELYGITRLFWQRCSIHYETKVGMRRVLTILGSPIYVYNSVADHYIRNKYGNVANVDELVEQSYCTAGINEWINTGFLFCHIRKNQNGQFVSYGRLFDTAFGNMIARIFTDRLNETITDTLLENKMQIVNRLFKEIRVIRSKDNSDQYEVRMTPNYDMAKQIVEWNKNARSEASEECLENEALRYVNRSTITVDIGIKEEEEPVFSVKENTVIKNQEEKKMEEPKTLLKNAVLALISAILVFFGGLALFAGVATAVTHVVTDATIISELSNRINNFKSSMNVALQAGELFDYYYRLFVELLKSGTFWIVLLVFLFFASIGQVWLKGLFNCIEGTAICLRDGVSGLINRKKHGKE